MAWLVFPWLCNVYLLNVVIIVIQSLDLAGWYIGQRPAGMQGLRQKASTQTLGRPYFLDIHLCYQLLHPGAWALIGLMHKHRGWLFCPLMWGSLWGTLQLRPSSLVPTQLLYLIKARNVANISLKWSSFGQYSALNMQIASSRIW